MTLPIDALRDRFDRLDGPVVVTAPTGSGKSTRVPSWCAGPVMVVEPRRVAARSLAAWLGGDDLGGEVGYAVRGESRSSARTRILYVTTGVALRMLAEQPHRFATVVLDEFHERSLDLDLLLALVHGNARLVVLSATIEGDRIARHLGGVHLEGEGRTFPVEVRYATQDRTLPSPDGLEERVCAALRSLSDHPGDRLVFVPGKAEIERVCRAVSALPDIAEVLPLHGSLTLEKQSRVFREDGPRRVVVATNVAETSVTLPRTRVVIDSGLVRRTHYRQDRGYLALLPIAADSADQRTGRAGRTAPGVAVRLWGAHAPLDTTTPPALKRESLVPLLLAAAAAGHPELDLPFLDPPPDHAVATARAHLEGLGALASSGITERGRRMFGLPLDARHGRLLVEAEAQGTLDRFIDIVAALSVGRDLFRTTEVVENLREDRCDVLGLMRAMERGRPDEHGLDGWVLREARATAKRLRAAFGVPPDRQPTTAEALAATLLTAWPDCVHVARRRKRRVAWSNGGTELALGRRSVIDEQASDLIAVVSSVALGQGTNATQLVTAAMKLKPAWVASAGIGRQRLAQVSLKRGAAVGLVERVHAGYVVAADEAPLTGELARDAVAQLFLRGTLFRGTIQTARDRFEARALSHALDPDGPGGLDAPDLESWVRQRVSELGVESGEDVRLLSPDDLLPDPLPDHRREELDRLFPRSLKMGNLRFRVEVEPRARRVTLHNLGPRIKKPPPVSWLPRFNGWSVRIEDRNTHRWLRRRP